VARQCELVSISRSGFYYQPAGETPLNLALMRLIDVQFVETPWYGSRQMARHLRREGYMVGRKRVRRLMARMGLEPIYQRPRTTIPHPGHRIYPYLLRDMVIDRPNQVWCADITYIPMRRGFHYLVAIMDWSTRKVLSWRVSNTMDAEFCVEALENALAQFGCPEIFNTDQGSQFTSDDFIGVLKKCQIKISMDGKGRCMDNVFVERLWRSLKYEEVYLHAYTSVSEAKSGIGAWLHFYNEERPHQTHDYRTPRQVYEAQYRWICGRSASPTGCAFDHIPTGTTISKGFNNDGSKGIVIVTAPP
jgi:putative transposase